MAPEFFKEIYDARLLREFDTFSHKSTPFLAEECIVGYCNAKRGGVCFISRIYRILLDNAQKVFYD